MVIGRRHSIDVTDATATVTLANTVSTRDVAAIRRHCREIPDGVQTLQLDLGGVTQFEGRVLQAVRGVVRDWRRTRRGECRLEFRSAMMVARVENH